MLTITFVRHGESVDNVKHIWAGWKDSDLSVHGFNQAKAIGEYFSDTKFSIIYASPLKRANITAQQIFERQKEPKPPFITSPLLREQHFGDAEGHSYMEPLSSSTSSPSKQESIVYAPVTCFPKGESSNDVAKRANVFVDLIIPHIIQAARKSAWKSEEEPSTKIAVVSHGIAISELIGALLQRDSNATAPAETRRGLLNTAWTRLVVGLEDEQNESPLDTDTSDPVLAKGPIEIDSGALLATVMEATNPPAETAQAAPAQTSAQHETLLTSTTQNPRSVRLRVRVTHINQATHLDNVKRQKGGIGSSTHDPAQTSITSFFGGAKPHDDQAKE